MAPLNSRSTTSACRVERGVIEHAKGSGLELKPSEYAKLAKQVTSAQCSQLRATDNIHIDVNILPLFITRGGHIKRPENAGDVDRHRSRAKVHARTDAAPPSESAVAKGAGIFSTLEEPLGFEVMRVRKVSFVVVDCKVPGVNIWSTLAQSDGLGNRQRTYWPRAVR